MPPEVDPVEEADEKNLGGRPPKYRAVFAKQAKHLCLLGATDEELAAFFEVDVRTIYRWKIDHAPFCQALKAGKEAADANVAAALYHRALGYSHPAVKILAVAVGGNNGSVVEKVPYTEHYPPDTTAAIFWLKNRQPAKWRDKHEMEHSAEGSLASLIAEAFKGDGAE